MKLKRFILHESLFLSLFMDGEIHVKVHNGLPKDTKFIRWYQIDGRIEIVIQSESFDELKDGDLIPQIQDIEFEKLY